MTPLPRCNDRFSLTDDEAVLNEKTQRILVEALVHTVVQSAVNVAIEKQDLEMSEHERALAHSSSALATELFLQKIRR